MFAMPLFNWQASENASILSDHFWIYWAVTVPLTIAVIAVWFVWITRKMNRHAKEDAAAGISDQELFSKSNEKKEEDDKVRSWWLNSFATGTDAERAKKQEETRPVGV